MLGNTSKAGRLLSVKVDMLEMTSSDKFTHSLVVAKEPFYTPEQMVQLELCKHQNQILSSVLKKGGDVRNGELSSLKYQHLETRKQHDFFSIDIVPTRFSFPEIQSNEHDCSNTSDTFLRSPIKNENSILYFDETFNHSFQSIQTNVAADDHMLASSFKDIEYLRHVNRKRCMESHCKAIFKLKKSKSSNQSYEGMSTFARKHERPNSP